MSEKEMQAVMYEAGELPPELQKLLMPEPNVHRDKIKFLMQILNSSAVLESRGQDGFTSEYTIQDSIYRDQIGDFIMIELKKYLKSRKS